MTSGLLIQPGHQRQNEQPPRGPFSNRAPDRSGLVGKTRKLFVSGEERERKKVMHPSFEIAKRRRAGRGDSIAVCGKTRGTLQPQVKRGQS